MYPVTMVLFTNIFCLNIKEIALNNTQINAIKPMDKLYKVMDEHSLYLYVNIVKKAIPIKKIQIPFDV